MSGIIIVDKLKSCIVHRYTDTHPRPELYYPFNEEPNRYVHIIVPSGLDPSTISIEVHNGEVMMYEDIAKKRQKQIELYNYIVRTVREKRNLLLANCDWIVTVPDAPITQEQKKAWITYRQALRDITKTISIDNTNVVWPTPPK